MVWVICIGLSALVASSIFVAVLDSTNTWAFYIAAFTSLLAAILTGVNSNLNFSVRAEPHHSAATSFQGLLREVQEEVVNCRNGDKKNSYEHLRTRWTEVLEGTPALPQDIFDKEERKINSDR